MKRFLLVVGLLGGLTDLGCRKEAPIQPGTSAAPRHVDVTVSNQGFTPARIPAKPGESLTLVFRYQKSAGECGREVVVPTQNVHVTLTEDKPVEVALTLPANKSEIGFACGMNMLHGAVVIE